MTWNTQAGKRILVGAEAALFREMVDDLHEQIRHLDREDFAISLFENLTQNSQVALVFQVAHALLCETETCPTLNAENEATIATIFEVGFESLTVELDLEQEHDVKGDQFLWRRLVRNASEELQLEDDLDDDSEDIPDNPADRKRRELDEWSLKFEILSDQILWDADFLDGDLFLDGPPSTPYPLAEEAEGYFTTIPPDPLDSEMENLHTMLNTLCRSDST
jgi:hypothetical protein